MKNLKIESYEKKLNLFLMLKLIYFSNPFGKMFILKSNLPSSCIIKCESQFGIQWEFYDLIQFRYCNSNCRASKLSSDMTMLSYFNIILNVNMITNSTFSTVFKIFIIFFS